MRINRKKSEPQNLSFTVENLIPWTILIGVTLIYTIILYPSLLVTREPVYEAGDVAKRDIKATIDFFVENEKMTERNRQNVVKQVLTVYDHDIKFFNKIAAQIDDAFSWARNTLQNTRKPLITKASKNSAGDNLPILPLQDAPKKMQDLDIKAGFEQRIGVTVSQEEFTTLKKEIFLQEMAADIKAILNKIMKNGVVSDKERLLKENNRGIVLRTIGAEKEKIVTQLKQFYGYDQAKVMVTIFGESVSKSAKHSIKPLTVSFSQRLIQPNITLNRHETEERSKKAAVEVKPALYKIKAGEMLLREGERVTEFQRMKLKAFQARTQKEQLLTSSIGIAMLILCFLLIVYGTNINSKNNFRRYLHRNLLFVACTFLGFLFIAKVSISLTDSLVRNIPFYMSSSGLYYGIPLAAGTMVVCLFLGIEIAIPFATVISIAAAILLHNRFELFIYFFLSSTMGAYWIQHCRERKVFIKVGVKLGLLNVILITAIDVYLGVLSGGVLLWDWGFAFQAGVVAGMITTGIAPLIEIAFNYTTDITLLELANFDQPLLRRLMIEAPGTYHHSVIVGSMVEAAAAEINANPLLAKACGYYHDVGKLRKPLYFIENQTDGKNRHDKLAPSMSSLILIAHVKNGIEMAQKHKLGQAISDTIQEHHGTSVISFFYEKAKKQRGEDAVEIDNYRYPGPKPQTREAGLVMLADVVEAASRTLQNPTPARIQGLVHNMINKIFSDGQLDNCELTLKDLHLIAKSFNKILGGIYHHRIEYPEPLVMKNGQRKNGSSDRQSVQPSRDTLEQNRTNGTGHLRRLGLP